MSVQKIKSTHGKTFEVGIKGVDRIYAHEASGKADVYKRSGDIVSVKLVEIVR